MTWREYLLLWLLVLVVLLVSGCGGGGGSGATPTVEPPSPTRTPTDIAFTYFGALDNSVLETCDHVSAIMTGGWGDVSTLEHRQAIAATAIQQLQQAKACGVTKAIVMIDFICYAPLLGPHKLKPLAKAQYAARGMENLAAELAAFFVALREAGVLDMVVALYPMDEPELYGLDATTVSSVNTAIRGVLQGFPELAQTKLAVVYSDNLDALPGISSYDLIGLDAYGLGAAVLTERYGVLRTRLRADQRLILVPGGAEPWKTAPQPFLDYALANPAVAVIMAFVWFPYEGGRGIGADGMASAYRAIGCQTHKPEKC
jgi:hypothetical protein